MKISIHFLLTLLILVFTISCDNVPNNAGDMQEDNVMQAQRWNEYNKINDLDSKFMTEATSSGMLEMTLAGVSFKKAYSPEVRVIGKNIKNTQSKMNVELKRLADERNVAIPTCPSDHHINILANSCDRKGLYFERTYLAEVINDHKNQIKLFELILHKSQDEGIKDFVARSLPVLRTHLAITQKMEVMVHEKKL